jgi:hypothetical protein
VSGRVWEGGAGWVGGWVWNLGVRGGEEGVGERAFELQLYEPADYTMICW